MLKIYAISRRLMASDSKMIVSPSNYAFVIIIYFKYLHLESVISERMIMSFNLLI